MIRNNEQATDASPHDIEQPDYNGFRGDAILNLLSNAVTTDPSFPLTAKAQTILERSTDPSVPVETRAEDVADALLMLRWHRGRGRAEASLASTSPFASLARVGITTTLEPVTLPPARPSDSAWHSLHRRVFRRGFYDPKIV